MYITSTYNHLSFDGCKKSFVETKLFMMRYQVLYLVDITPEIKGSHTGMPSMR